MRKSRFSEEQIIGLLKQVVADLTLDNRALEDIASRNW
jgi:hypothetical protein